MQKIKSKVPCLCIKPGDGKWFIDKDGIMVWPHKSVMRFINEFKKVKKGRGKVRLTIKNVKPCKK